MYDDKFSAFYAAYSNPLLWPGERAQEEEFRLMRSYYPETARRLQELVEEECQLLDYEGSRIYDEYPDRFMLYRMCTHIRREAERRLTLSGMPEDCLGELIQVLLFQEIARRRCRRRRCRNYF